MCADKLKFHVSQTKIFQNRSSRRKFNYFLSRLYLKIITLLSVVSVYDTLQNLNLEMERERGQSQ